MDDLKAKLQQKTTQLKGTDRQLRELLDAADNFANAFGEIKRGRRGDQLQALRHAAEKFVEVFTQIKLAHRGYKISQ
jgi:hypothetical protein